MKKIIMVILTILLISCNIPDSKPETLHNIELINNFAGIEFTKSFKYGAAFIDLENITDTLIIEISYNLNDRNILIYDVIVPNEKIRLYFTKSNIVNVVCEIENVVFY